MGLSLVIGSRHLCGASFSAWLALRRAERRFVDQVVPLGRPDSLALLASLSPTGSVPVLIADGVTIPGALAIAEHAAGQVKGLWPEGAAAELAHSTARQAAEGFPELAAFLPMDITARFSAPG